MNDILFMIVQVLFAAAIMAILRYLIPLLTRSLREHDLDFVADIVEYAVRAAEQIFAGVGRGEEKYKYVKQYVLEQLAKYKIDLTEEQLNQLIEAMVQAMNSEKGAVEVDE